MIYFLNASTNSKVVKNYQRELPPSLNEIYEKIVIERRNIYYVGYILGFIVSLIVIYYNIYGLSFSLKSSKTITPTFVKAKKLSVWSMLCIVISISFIISYFYYTLSPKTNWMLDNITTPSQSKAWLQMYRAMQVYYHSGLVLGILAIASLSVAFRCYY
jgi:hypothetical protein